jgi:uncharacterized protein
MNQGLAIVDTGVLVAALDRQDTHHAWAKSVLLAVITPAITCEAVITETLFLLSRISGGEQAIFGLLAKQVLSIDFALNAEHAVIAQLMQTYRSVPMSLADAGRIAENLPKQVFPAPKGIEDVAAVERLIREHLETRNRA